MDMLYLDYSLSQQTVWCYALGKNRILLYPNATK